MIIEAFTLDGQVISASDAVGLRDRKRTVGTGDPTFIDPATGETLILPRSGHATPLSHAQPHFYHPAERVEKGFGKETKAAVLALEEILKSKGVFGQTLCGILGFSNVRSSIEHDAPQPDFDYGFHVVWTKRGDGKEFAFIVLNRVPNSKEYVGMLNSLGNRERFERQPNITKYVVDYDGEKHVIGRDVYLATVQLMNKHLYRLNQEQGHPENALMLGDFQLQILSQLYPQFVYFDAETNALYVVELQKFGHACSYSYQRHGVKTQFGGSADKGSFCQMARSMTMDLFTAEPFEINKGARETSIGDHTRLYLAKIVPQQQARLF